MQTVIELEVFSRRARKLFTEEERIALAEYVSLNPYTGDEIPGTGGVRKLRFGAKSRGKRGGSRVIYFVYDDNLPIYLLACYGKNERIDLTNEEKAAVSAFAAAIKTAARKGKQR